MALVEERVWRNKPGNPSVWVDDVPADEWTQDDDRVENVPEEKPVARVRAKGEDAATLSNATLLPPLYPDVDDDPNAFAGVSFKDDNRADCPKKDEGDLYSELQRQRKLKGRKNR